jgi:V-type H+-transporting ATPase subunit d
MLVMSVQELLDKCHPLGMFDSIATLAVASSMRELYRLVLVDTPLAPYFSESLSAGESSFPRTLPLRSYLVRALLSNGCLLYT